MALVVEELLNLHKEELIDEVPGLRAMLEERRKGKPYKPRKVQKTYDP